MHVRFVDSHGHLIEQTGFRIGVTLAAGEAPFTDVPGSRLIQVAD